MPKINKVRPSEEWLAVEAHNDKDLLYLLTLKEDVIEERLAYRRGDKPGDDEGYDVAVSGLNNLIASARQNLISIQTLVHLITSRTRNRLPQSIIV
ncbi:hypothetical protein IPL68_03505 [Candidatus Saccharibacteria bacterium]|nr:MAG: hypothetical protein IPL68_03505 [Candidatus Saccharibacteria bacterium]